MKIFAHVNKLQNLKRHLQYYHTLNQERKCPHCYKMFGNEHNLHCHVTRMHQAQKLSLGAQQRLKQCFIGVFEVQ